MVGILLCCLLLLLVCILWCFGVAVLVFWLALLLLILGVYLRFCLGDFGLLCSAGILLGCLFCFVLINVALSLVIAALILFVCC